MKKHKPFKPPLSFLDKCVYCFAFLMAFILPLLFVIGCEYFRDLIAFNDLSTLAYTPHVSFFILLPFLFYFLLSSIVFLYVKFQEKKPIFGNRKIIYGQPPWDKSYYPLFDARRKKLYEKPSQKKYRKHMLVLWCSGLILTFILVPFGFLGRDCLQKDNRVISYNAFNQVQSEYTPSNFTSMTLQTRYVVQNRGANYWEFEMLIKMNDGARFSFSNLDFDLRKEACIDDCLAKMMELKRMFTAKNISIVGAEDVDKAADYLGLDESQTLLLQELFSEN